MNQARKHKIASSRHRQAYRAAAAALAASEQRAAQALERERAARAEAEQAIRRLEAIQYVTEGALSRLDLDDLLPELLSRIREVLHSDTATVLLVDESEQFLAVRAAVGLDMAGVRDMRIPVGRGIAGRVAASRAPLVIPDLASEELVRDGLRRYLRSLAAVPLLAAGRVIGVLHVGTADPRHFGAEDVRLLQLVADRAALGIDNAQLYQRAQFEQARWQATVESMLDPVTVADAQGHAIYMNAAYTHMVDRTIQPGLAFDRHAEHYQLYRPDGTLFDPKDLPLQTAALEGREAANVEIIQRTPAGAERIVIWNASPLRSPEGALVGAVAIGHDITAQRHAEAERERLLAEIQRSHSTLEALINTMQAGVVFCNAAGEITLTNPAAASMFQGPITGDAYGPQGGYTLHRPDGAPYPSADLPLARALRGEISQQVEILVRRRDGGQAWIWAAARPIQDDSGAITGAVASLIDISELKRVERALQDAAERLELRVQERTRELSQREASLQEALQSLSQTAQALEQANQTLSLREASLRDTMRALQSEIGERRLAEEAVRRHSQHVEVLHDIDHAALAASSAAAVAEAAVRRIRAAVGCARASVLAFSDRRVQLLAVDGPAQVTLESGASPALDAMDADAEYWQSDVHLFNDLQAADALPPVPAAFKSAGLGSYLSAPLAVQGRLIGRLNLAASAPGAFGREEQELVRHVADSLAVAIHSAMLFEEVTSGRERLLQLSRRLVEIQEEERRDIARELHDQAGQLLTALKVGLTLLERDLPATGPAAARIKELKATAEEVQESLHALAVDLRPASLDRVGVSAALRQYIDSFHRRTGLDVEYFDMDMEHRRLPKEIELALYRVVQEALTNVLRHAHANHIGAILELRGDTAVAIVEDDGVGFDPDAAMRRGRLGLFGMRERVEAVGGQLTVESTPGHGTTIFVEVPCRLPGASETDPLEPSATGLPKG